MKIIYYTAMIVTLLLFSAIRDKKCDKIVFAEVPDATPNIKLSEQLPNLPVQLQWL